MLTPCAIADANMSRPSTANSILKAALGYLHRGWSIIPIAAGTKKPPRGFKWKRFQGRQPTEEEARTWFADRDDLGLAVILGTASGGLVCRDFDDGKVYDYWKKSHRDLARMVPTVRTRRGFHLYCRAPEERLVFVDLRPKEHGEFRGDSAHYCVLPPSQHPDGTEYEWIVPLPEGDLPLIADVVAAGFFPGSDVTQKAQGNRRKSHVIISPRASDTSRARLSDSAKIAIDDAIGRTLPTCPGMRRRKLFELARTLKFHPEFQGTPTTEIDFLRPYVKRWWNLAKPHTSGNHPHFHQTWQDFVFGWEEARVPVGATMQQLFERARSLPVPAEAVEKYGQGSLRVLLANLCRVLQEHSGTKPFPLNGRTVGPLLGVSDVHAWRWLRELEQDGFIQPAKKYPLGKRLATEWLYVGG